MSSQPQITQSIEEAAEALLAGRIVAIPTETVYGLAADATNPAAVAEVFALKGRPTNHPLIVHCSSPEEAWKCTQHVTPAAGRLADAFWPGPMTLVLTRSESVKPSITGGQDSVAVRIPAHTLTRQLLAAVGRPLVAPSANRFGRVSPTTAEHVKDEFPDSELLILDGGACEVGIESTIVDCRSDATVQILRPGKITEHHLIQILGAKYLSAAEVGTPVKVSGTLPSHYAPRAKVILVEPGDLKGWCESEAKHDLRTVVITPCSPPPNPWPGITWHSISKDTDEFAQQLYALFRQADDQSFMRIVVELPSVKGIGAALRDRLQRAANDPVTE